MKKLIWVFALMFLLTGVAYAQSSVKENCGCGLGYVVFKDTNSDSILIQVVATCLNGTFGNQTFGISSGTLGCEKPSRVAMIERMDTFVADNMDSLAVDIAAGGGESLDALSEIAQVAPEKKDALYAALQNNFENIYLQDDVNHKVVVEKITQIIEQI